MSGNLSVEKATEKIARRLSREAGQPEALWQLFLMEAYNEHFGLTRTVPDTDRTSEADA